jgi:hypothetical protein
MMGKLLMAIDLDMLALKLGGMLEAPDNGVNNDQIYRTSHMGDSSVGICYAYWRRMEY